MQFNLYSSKHHSPPRQLLDSIEASISSEDSLSQCIDDKLQLNIQDDKQLNKKTVQFSPMPTKVKVLLHDISLQYYIRL
ncbi:hypothetical protein GJ496_007134 [Pomphorhynchus laevis]|nr:hypothetical protein GJ496_006890 [Pomphorhynchus laevis]KAI0990198.1 hypothetical protein GJ496_007134 [Pomphorhynchus laevis]